MRIREYLERKYQMRVPTTISHSEARAFFIPWPLKNGWLYEHGARVISRDMAHEALVYQRKRVKKKSTSPKLAAIAERGCAILEDYLSRDVPAVPVSAKPKIFKRASPAAVRERAKSHPHASTDFLQTYEWRRVRMEAIKKYGRRCQCCGASPEIGAVINVDHIKPRRLFPELALDVNNLQVLCAVCNHGKGNWDMTDWREHADVL